MEATEGLKASTNLTLPLFPETKYCFGIMVVSYIAQAGPKLMAILLLHLLQFWDPRCKSSCLAQSPLQLKFPLAGML